MVTRRASKALNEVFRPGPDRRLFYGWRIVGAGTVLQILVSGLFLQAYGAYVVLIQADLGWSRTMLSAGFAMARTESAILGPIQGHLIDRFGPRAIMRLGLALAGTGFLLLSVVQQPWQFFGAMLILAVGTSLSGFLSIVVAVVNWFRRRRATALSIASIGSALGGVLVPAVATFMTTFGWRVAALTSGILVLTVGPVAAQIIRHRPSDLGLHIDGVAPSVAVVEEALELESSVSMTADTDFQGSDFTSRQALRTMAFWQISLGHGLAVMLVSALTVHLIPHLTGALDYSLEFAGLMVALVTSMQMVGQAFGAVFGDRASKQVIALVAMILHGGSVLVLAVAVTPPLVAVFAVMHGVAWGIRGPLLQAWRADLFGSSSFGAIMGYSSVVVMLGAAGGPLVAGVLFDYFGDYSMMLRVLAILAAVGALMFGLVRRPEPRSPASSPPSDSSEPRDVSDSDLTGPPLGR